MSNAKTAALGAFKYWELPTFAVLSLKDISFGIFVLKNYLFSSPSKLKASIISQLFMTF